MGNMSEHQLQEACISLLRYGGWVIIRANSGQASAEDDERGKKRFIAFLRWYARGVTGKTTGVSDVIACSPSGRFYAFEFKVGKRHPTADQILFLNAVKECNGGAFEIRSIQNMQDAIEQEKKPLW